MSDNDAIKLGPFRLKYQPDGDDPKTGWLLIENRYDFTKMQCTRADWEWFKDMAQ